MRGCDRLVRRADSARVHDWATRSAQQPEPVRWMWHHGRSRQLCAGANENSTATRTCAQDLVPRAFSTVVCWR